MKEGYWFSTGRGQTEIKIIGRPENRGSKVALFSPPWRDSLHTGDLTVWRNCQKPEGAVQAPFSHHGSCGPGVTTTLRTDHTHWVKKAIGLVSRMTACRL